MNWNPFRKKVFEIILALQSHWTLSDYEKFIDFHSPDLEAEEFDENVLWPDESLVMQIAGQWSIDPLL